jgi:hypothetical protein
MGVMTTAGDKTEMIQQQTARHMIEGVYYRVVYVAIIDYDRSRDTRLNMTPVFCPDKRGEVVVPRPIADAIKETHDLVCVVAEEDESEHRGYAAFVRKDKALLAAESIKFYASGSMNGAGGCYLEIQVEVAECEWDSFGAPLRTSDGERIKYFALTRDDYSGDATEHYLPC